MQASEGVGWARKWIVKLNGGVLERFSARTLELEQRHLITPPSTSIRAVSLEEEDSCSSNTSSDESSTSDNDKMRKVDEDGASRRASKRRFRKLRLPLFNVRCGSLSNTSLCLCLHGA